MASTTDKSLLLAHEAVASSGSSPANSNNLTTTMSAPSNGSQLCEPVSPKPRAKRKISLPWFRQSSFGLGSGGERKSLSKQNTIAIPDQTHKNLAKQNTIAFPDSHLSSSNETFCEVSLEI